MTILARPLHPLFAAELAGLDLHAPADAARIAEVKRLMDIHAVAVVHHDRTLTDAEHIAFSDRLGPIERRPILKVSGATDALRVPHHEIIDQSNLDETGAIYRDDDRRLFFKRANRQWHTDMSFHPVRATYSLLSAHEVPPDGAAPTEFADMRAAYDALPAAMKARLDGLVAAHSYWHSRVLGGGPAPTEEELRSRPPACHRLVHTHPGSGRKALYLASHIAGIVGMAEAGARSLLAELTAFATDRRFVYSHAWRVGDVVIWDNLATMHRATPFDDCNVRRDMRRTTCREAEVPV
ncbi:MAG: TauD/TfdA family dioxygenase [Alphaproteobacteria bacterium]|nr:TauD/TfdA family dioxygenase [Alphaproteobacteria bacterium]